MSSSQLEDYSLHRNCMTIAVKPEMQQRSSFRVASKEAMPAASNGSTNLHQGNNSEEVTEEDDEEEAKESIQPILRRQENVVVQPSKSLKIFLAFWLGPINILELCVEQVVCIFSFADSKTLDIKAFFKSRFWEEDSIISEDRTIRVQIRKLIFR